MIWDDWRECVIYEVQVAQEFAAAHWLHNYPGNCGQLHGHTWKVEITLMGEELDEAGMLVDFREARRLLGEVTGRFDHKLINEIKPFDTMSPTAENLARIIFEQLKSQFVNCKLESVRVWETSAASACYREEA
ncbi:MAG TPA: 6-carboxytetrahydropterin synthase QueD [Syntrophomonadaceae bacterium]|nr:6-carboxytetrahydropterin synthase QueD [Syntrophomonadaceae bacterium]